jgi:glycosyltransferase involved in cell wall biosynthesis
MYPLSILIISGEDVHLRIPSIIELIKLGYEVSVAGPVEHPRFLQESIPFYKYSLVRAFDPWSDYHAIKQIQGIYKACSPDIVHAFDTKPCLLVPMAFGGKKGPHVVRTINGMGAVFSESSVKMLLLRGVYLSLHFWLRGRLSATIFQNEGDMAFFKSYKLSTDINSIKIAGSGVAVQEIEQRLALSNRSNIRKSLSLTGKTVFILVSRMIRSKGIEEFITAADIVGQVTDTAHFLLVGPSGDNEPDSISEHLLDKLDGNISYIGSRSDIYELMGASDCFVLPTAYKEGLPRAMLEALVVGLPIVVSDTPGCLEGALAGENGWVVPPKDSIALSRAIIECLKLAPDKRKNMGIIGRAYAIDRFGIDTVVSAMDQLYKGLYRDKHKSVE